MTGKHGLTLIIGGTGKIGRRVAERLSARGMPIRVGTRSSEPVFDWEDPTTWPTALRGAESAYVSYSPDLALPGAANAVRELAATAVGLGVRRLVLLSGRGEEGALRGEQAVRDSGAEWTIVRSSWFSQNFSEGPFLDQVRTGVVALPAGPVREPFVDADDIAEVATAALTEDGHVRRVYELTGPRLLTFAEAVAEIARAAAREIRYLPISLEEYAAAMAEQGVPGPVVSLVTYLFAEVLDGRNAQLADGVQRALGRAPRDFAEYARSTAASGVWNP